MDHTPFRTSVCHEPQKSFQRLKDNSLWPLSQNLSHHLTPLLSNYHPSPPTALHPSLLRSLHRIPSTIFPYTWNTKGPLTPTAISAFFSLRPLNSRLSYGHPLPPHTPYAFALPIPHITITPSDSFDRVP